MTYVDWIGAVGVFLILLAYYLNSYHRVSTTSSVYLYLNLIGAGTACAASILLNYWPFIILESAWVLVTLVTIIRLKTYRQD